MPKIIDINVVDIVTAYTVSNYNVRRTAKTLNIDVHTLYSYIDKFGIRAEITKRREMMYDFITDEAIYQIRKKIEEGDTTAIIFWLKTRAGFSEKMIQEHIGEIKPLLIKATNEL